MQRSSESVPFIIITSSKLQGGPCMAVYRVLPGRTQRIKRDGHSFDHRRRYHDFLDHEMFRFNVRKDEARYLGAHITEAIDERRNLEPHLPVLSIDEQL